jgi:hypothetical protein
VNKAEARLTATPGSRLTTSIAGVSLRENHRQVPSDVSDITLFLPFRGPARRMIRSDRGKKQEAGSLAGLLF